MKRKTGWQDAVAVLAILVLTMLWAILPVACKRTPEPTATPEVIEIKVVRERIAIKARADSYVYEGADIIFYSDNLSTETGRIDGAGGMQLAIPTAQTTSTPGFLIDCAHLGTCIEVRDASTPVWTISNGGGIAHTGDETYAGGSTFNNWIKGAAPTAIATATPAVVLDSLGVSVILDVRDAATPVFSIRNGGDVIQTGARTASGGDTINNWLVVSAPTAIATATPGAVVDSLGVSVILEVRDAATPVFAVRNGGTLDIGNGSATFSGTVLDLNDSYLDQDVDTENVGVLPSVVSTAITYTAAAGGTGAVATIADGEIWFVHAVFVNVTTDFDCTGDDATLVVGDGADGDGFVTLADAELQTADAEQTGSPAGWQGLVAATMGVYLDGAVSSAPHIYAPSGAAETIDWLVDESSGESITAGAATIYVVYTRIQ